MNRKQTQVKIDHNFNQSHKINGSYTYERNWSDNQYGVWPFRFPTLCLPAAAGPDIEFHIDAFTDAC